jgi:hypothetical protein
VLSVAALARSDAQSVEVVGIALNVAARASGACARSVTAWGGGCVCFAAAEDAGFAAAGDASGASAVSGLGWIIAVIASVTGCACNAEAKAQPLARIVIGEADNKQVR